MSSTGSNGSGSSLLDALTQAAGANGQAAGNQAQAAIALTLFVRLVQAVEGFTPTAGSPFANNTWTGGDLDIAAEFPNLTTGTFSIEPASPGPITVTIPDTGGPWLIVDGSGFCDPSNQITVQSSGGVTVFGATAYYMVQARQSGIFVLAGTNYNLF